MADTVLWITIASALACTVLWSVVPSSAGRTRHVDAIELRRHREFGAALTGPRPTGRPSGQTAPESDPPAPAAAHHHDAPGEHG
ncbi:hypothetical protein [Streptomyces sp. Wb2n-11]|uniref:hypothetical protein n=1 Tax=Streptomyces sp. Wb2n-11 TaxID=1030533 RepID=UPI000A579388|nr:hypothetical protein [Streptomyces sp. Wb2n-11]